MVDPTPTGPGITGQAEPGVSQGVHGAGEISAAGAVLWRPGEHGPEVALIHRPRYGDWSFPKGKADPGEHPLLTAVREVSEETGIRPVLGRPLAPVRYQAKGRPKRVDYWAATPSAGSSVPLAVGDPALAEVDAVEWLPLAAARERLSYAHDIALLTEFAAGSAAGGGDPGTTAFILLRHGTAELKQGWPDDDLLRPLDPPGREQAGVLAALLACFGTARVISSATARCVDTVLPYAMASGVTVRAEPGLVIGGAVRAAEHQLTELAGEPVPTIFCGHGETLPGQLAALCARFGAEPPPDPELDKGSFWVLHIGRSAEGTPVLSALEQHSC